MSPSVTSMDATYCGWIKMKLPSNYTLGLASLKTLSDRKYDLVRQDCVPPSCALGVPPFFNAVSDIIRVSSKKQMGWIYTRWIVTAMKYVHLAGIVVMNCVRQAMCQESALANTDNAIMLNMGLTYPDPTWAKFRADGWAVLVNLDPQSIYQLLGYGIKDRIAISHINSFVVGLIRVAETFSASLRPVSIIA